MKLSYFLLALILCGSMPHSQAFEHKETKLVPHIQSHELLGQWRVVKIIFDQLPADTISKFTSYYMHRGIVRYAFKEEQDFSFVVPGKVKNNPEDGKYWDWHYDPKKQTLEIRQINPKSPPFDFGFDAEIVAVHKYLDYTEITLRVRYHADSQTATVILSNSQNETWNTPPICEIVES